MDDQVIITSEYHIQERIFELFKMVGEYNMEVSTTKTEVLAFQGK
jgi:hypothetical protein